MDFVCQTSSTPLILHICRPGGLILSLIPGSPHLPPPFPLTSDDREMVSSAMSRLGVGMGLGPQKDDSISMV